MSRRANGAPAEAADAGRAVALRARQLLLHAVDVIHNGAVLGAAIVVDDDAARLGQVSVDVVPCAQVVDFVVHVGKGPTALAQVVVRAARGLCPRRRALVGRPK